jgi:GNAT superfamily N-acetyltransferase
MITLVHQGKQTIDGFACAHDVGFRAYLSEFVVAPARQRQGLGSELLAEIERPARHTDAPSSLPIVARRREILSLERLGPPPVHYFGSGFGSFESPRTRAHRREAR